MFYRVRVYRHCYLVYLDDLLDLLESNGNIVLAYADDIAIILNGKGNLIKNIKLIEWWCSRNGMELNKNKSGIYKII